MINLSNFDPATDDEIRNIINKSSNTSCEMDPIPTWLLKDCLEPLLPIITSLINISLRNGEVPDNFKYAHIRPHLKKATLDQNILENYRPVSNLSFLSKVLEKVVARRLDQYMDDNELQEKYQSAYTKLHSTETALIKVHSDIMHNIDDGKAVALVLLDLSAAFDTIDHSILLNRLRNVYGITGNALKWMTSYLQNRRQSVIIDNIKSAPLLLKYGVPQGSVLGPKLYTMYTKPLGDLIRQHGLDYHMYADDTQIYLSFKPLDFPDAINPLHILETCLEDVRKWMADNMLKLNDDKTDVIFFHSKHSKRTTHLPSLRMGNDVIPPSSSVRNLGVLFDSYLSMENHINLISRSCYNQ
ncbi:putative RNA-directed DNA polymerase from mobile element jockey-like [Apostichopus japonicus]|uniref:Putative RNA-directed DNA polymerase from mobile element jockey-like n=1 Tax=Stichopus japonicus TaxID=307972 RepID=A0A2G8JRJ7_STIJA|nr:putative RNA-directed DNA polymerase from mobile element jockey-like [Apostichopus japonicus]